ncbi:MAG: phosphatase PAP2 family protein [Actinomycetota bacterium]|nr:phosphatase PAP2 family protein [Actinomycetota bacterium]
MIRKISRHLSLAITLELAAGFVISLGALWAFAELAEVVFEGETRQLDTAVLLWIHSTFPGWLDTPMRLVTSLGYPWVAVPLLLLAVYIFYRNDLRFSAALLLISVPGAAVLSTVLKGLFERARPELFDSGYEAPFYSFPSGHAVTAVSFYGVLTLLVAWRLEGWSRWVAVVAGTLLMLLVGFSRLYLGVHYPSDILAGYLAATLWVGTVGMALTLWRSLRSVKRCG